MIIVDSLEEEEEERTEEDKEVEKNFKKGQEVKRKILTGTVLYFTLCRMCWMPKKISTSISYIECMYMLNMLNSMTFLFVAVRKVVASHKMVAQGHATVAAGWELFEEAVEEAGPGDLPNLLHQLKGKTTPMQMTPLPPASPMEVGEKTPMLPHASPVKKEAASNEDPVIVMWGG